MAQTKFLEALAKAGADDLAQIDERLAALDKERAGLMAARRVLDCMLNGPQESEEG